MNKTLLVDAADALMQQRPAELQHQLSVLVHIQLKSPSILNFVANFAHFSSDEAHDLGRLQVPLIDQGSKRRTLQIF